MSREYAGLRKVLDRRNREIHDLRLVVNVCDDWLSLWEEGKATPEQAFRYMRKFIDEQSAKDYR